MSISLNLNKISNEIPKDVLLVAVSKTKPISDIQIAYNSGQLHFGENQIQELFAEDIELSDIMEELTRNGSYIGSTQMRLI